MTSLTPQRFEQRLTDLEGAFRRLGEVAVARGSESPQTVLITIDHPGWGVPRRARMRFVETWQREGDAWELVRYAYDLLADPSPGRFGFHWHDGTHHTHCVDDEAPNKDHHYRSAPLYPTVESRAAHPLIDGNKRTGALLAADGRSARR